jgi:hypothetical protein
MPYLPTYLLTPWSRVLLEKQTGSQLVNKFPSFYGTQRFITAVTSARHLSLSSASLIQSKSPTSHFLKTLYAIYKYLVPFVTSDKLTVKYEFCIASVNLLVRIKIAFLRTAYFRRLKNLANDCIVIDSTLCFHFVRFIL